MKLKFLLLIFFIPIFFKAFSQQTTAYAITGQGKGNFNWTDIRTIDMKSGNAMATLFQNGKTKFLFMDAGTGRPVSFSNTSNLLNGNAKNIVIKVSEVSTAIPSPTALMSAAIAYDKKHDRLFFATMKTGQLIWMDLQKSSGEPVFYTTSKPLLNYVNYNDEALNITRMTIGADGYGYALTNDANHLIKFTTGNKIIATDMGSLLDDEHNSGISVHNKCSSWGGDLVADAFGKLYLFSAGRNVFIINPQTLVATYAGAVTNLSATFSINGAAAIDDENVMVSTANTFEGFYKVNAKTFAATKINTDRQIYNASDLASGNLLHESEKISSLGTPVLSDLEPIGNSLVTIYPNPVSNNGVKITFEGNMAGKYLIELTDLQGRIVEAMQTYIKSPGEITNFQFRRKQPGGLYLIKITDDTRKTIYSDKLVVE